MLRYDEAHAISRQSGKTVLFSFTANKLETAGQRFITSQPNIITPTDLMNRVMGREALCLWGPDLDLMVNTPPSLSSIQDLGAASRFR